LNKQPRGELREAKGKKKAGKNPRWAPLESSSKEQKKRRSLCDSDGVVPTYKSGLEKGWLSFHEKVKGRTRAGLGGRGGVGVCKEIQGKGAP